MTYRIAFTPSAVKMLGAVQDRRVREKLASRIEMLCQEPEKQGKPLLGELAGYRSVRAVGQRYHIIYRVERQQVIVLVIAVGLRRQASRSDIYELARKLLRLRLIE